MAYLYEIGATEIGMVTLESLGLKAPKNEYAIYANSITLGDGSERGVGSPMFVWNWGYLTSAQRATLRAYCTGKSANVFIKTIKDDNSYVTYSAIMVWPNSEERAAGRVLDFSIEFRQAEAV